MMWPFEMSVEDYAKVHAQCAEIAATVKPYFVAARREPMYAASIMDAIASKAAFAPHVCDSCGVGSYRQTFVDGKTWMCDACVIGVPQERLCK